MISISYSPWKVLRMVYERILTEVFALSRKKVWDKQRSIWQKSRYHRNLKQNFLERHKHYFNSYELRYWGLGFLDTFTALSDVSVAQRFQEFEFYYPTGLSAQSKLISSSVKQQFQLFYYPPFSRFWITQRIQHFVHHAIDVHEWAI